MKQAMIKTYSKKELCNLYGISSDTLRERLKPLKLSKFRKVLLPKDIEKVFNLLGTPLIAEKSGEK
jgi:hypothetical protein